MRDILDILEYEIGHLREALRYLNESYHRCLKIDIGSKFPLSDDELIELEALSARFSRCVDIILKKIFRYMDELELENNKNIIDRIQSAEKRELISSDKDWFDIRNLRNYIAHEYSSMNFRDTISEIIKYTPEVLKTGENIIHYTLKIKNKLK
ncbi:MAG: hypothetical protein KatS3mg028_0767 [Bacteroidia bacterium]|nr:MAG: hypothetical protein KatS3mg028_0767 [Bacteroidia bacterium]